MLIEDGSQWLVDGIDLDALVAPGDSAYLLTPDLVLVGYSHGYVDFARENGRRNITAISPFGTRLTEAMREPLATTYREIYQRVLRTGESHAHSFECSSPAVYRRFRQIAYRVGGGRALLVVNTPEIVRPFVLEGTPVVSDYRGADGGLTECGQCRRLKDPLSGRWDHVAAHVADPDDGARQDICPHCRDVCALHDRRRTAEPAGR